MWKYVFTIGQVIFKYRSIVREAQDVYQKYLAAREDGKITVEEMRGITDEVFDVVAVLIPALKELKTTSK